MIKVTTNNGGDVARLLVEGSLSDDGVDVLRQAASEVGNGRMVVDLRGVTFLGREGAELVRALARRGAVLEGMSPFVAELMRGCGP